jgi:6-pyruvoyltetrahydropterin/6-carboxytetrahydropterin synthase
MGWIDDFSDIDSVVAPVVKMLDHRCLNDIVENPTSENLATWIARALSALNLASVTVSETRKSRARWTP